MHPNPAYRHGDSAALDALADRIGLGAIFLLTPDGPRVAHAPVLVGGGTLRFHLARGNALTRHLNGAQALACLTGPHAYVSARWYADAEQVSTWNYVALEYEGAVRRMDEAELLRQLTDLTERHEGRVRSGGIPWTMDKLSDKTRAQLLRGIVGFELAIEQRRETIKLAQHKRADERDRLIAGLEAEGASAIAALMRGGLPA